MDSVRFSVLSNLPLAHIIDPKIEKTIYQRLLNNTAFTEDFRKHFISHFYFERDIGRHKNVQSIISKKIILFEKSKTFFSYYLWSELIHNSVSLKCADSIIILIKYVFFNIPLLCIY